MGQSYWNQGTGGYVDRLTGQQLATMGQDRNSIVSRILGQAAGGAPRPAYYGDSYGGVQGAAATARQRATSYEIAQLTAAQQAAQFDRQRREARDAREDVMSQAEQQHDWNVSSNEAYQNWISKERELARQHAIKYPNARVGDLPGAREGGYTGDGPPSEVAPTVVHRGEYVLPAWLTKQLGLDGAPPPTPSRLREGFLAGGYTGDESWNEPDYGTPVPMTPLHKIPLSTTEGKELPFEIWQRRQALKATEEIPTPYERPPAVARSFPAVTTVTPPLPDDGRVREPGPGRWVPTMQMRRDPATGKSILTQDGWQGVNIDGKVTARIPINHPAAAAAAADHALNVKDGRTVWNPKALRFEDGGSVYTMKKELAPHINAQEDVSAAARLAEERLKELDTEEKVGEKTGTFIWNKETKQYEGAPGQPLTELPDGTPLSPEQVAGSVISRQKQNERRARAIVEEREQRLADAARLKALQKAADDKVGEVESRYEAEGLRVERPPVSPSTRQPGAGGVILKNGRPAAVVLPKPEIGPLPGPRRPSPDDLAFRRLKEADDLAKLRKANADAAVSNAREVERGDFRRHNEPRLGPGIWPGISRIY
jgi:hypothetical protein